MPQRSIVVSLIFAAGLLLLPGCASRTMADPPPQSPAGTEAASTDAGLPMVPLTGKGVIVPSDVKLEPAPREAAPTPASSVTATPTGN